MPTFRHGKKTAVLLNSTDMSLYLNEATVSRDIETNDTTTFGSNSRSYITGLDDGTISLSGMFDSTANASDEVLEGRVLQENNTLTVLPEGLIVGSRAILVNADMTAYEISAPVADVISIEAGFQADGGVRQGFVLAATTGTASGTASSVDFDSTLSNGAVFHLHVTENTYGSATTFKVQDSADNISFVDVVTFSPVGGSAVTSQRVIELSPVNRYMQAVSDIDGSTGSVSFSISAARR
jgi:hypothetical protein